MEFKSYLIDLVKTNENKKDGDSMCAMFSGMIDKAEQVYGCIVVCFCCDNDGGSQSGQKKLILARPWLFGPPCCAHQVRSEPFLNLPHFNLSLQFQLTLGDYFKENQAAAETAEEATNLLGWFLGHQRVRAIFDEAQALRNRGTVLAYLVANLTRWTTHYTAFRRLLDLKIPIRHAVVLSRDAIVAAQVGAEHNAGKRRKLSDAANTQCDVIESAEFWNQLQMVVDDIEPI
jgi:hypothetical protein